jgi:serine/threonine protein kinase
MHRRLYRLSLTVLFSISPFSVLVPYSDEDDEDEEHETSSIEHIDYSFHYFDKVEPLFPINMGFVSLGRKYPPQESRKAPTEKQYILKRFSKDSVVRHKFTKVVKAEAKILSALHSSFICRMFGKFQTPDELVLVLERVPGCDMWQLIYEEDDLRGDDGFLPMHIARFYVASISLALEHMHDRGIVYRNLKPENILIDAEGYIKLTGMGFAKKIPYVNALGHLSGMTFTFCGTMGELYI